MDERTHLPIVITDEQYKFLVDSACRYASSKGSVLDIAESGDRGIVIAGLYEQLKNIIDKDCSLDLFLDDDDNNELYFVLNRFLHEEMTCYFIPFRFTYEMKDQAFGLIVRKFLRSFTRANGWSSIYDTYLFDMLEESYTYEQEDCDEEYASYFGEGIAKKRIRDMKETPFLDASELLSFSPSEDDRELYDLMVSGLKYIDERNPVGMFNYLWSECYFRDLSDEDLDDGSVDFGPIESIFSLVYDKDDTMTENLMSYITDQNYSGTSVQDILVDQRTLRADRDVEFTSDGVVALIKFVIDFIDASDRYEKCK